jgi:hypothetical protein
VDEAYALLITSPLSPSPLSSNLNIFCFFSDMMMNYMPRLADLELLQFFAMLKMGEIIGGFDMGLRNRQ